MRLTISRPLRWASSYGDHPTLIRHEIYPTDNSIKYRQSRYPRWSLLLRTDIMALRRRLRMPADSAKPFISLQPVRRAPNPEGPAIQHMGINHRGGHVPVPQQLLHRADVVAILQQMGRK